MTKRWAWSALAVLAALHGLSARATAPPGMAGEARTHVLPNPEERGFEDLELELKAFDRRAAAWQEFQNSLAGGSSQEASADLQRYAFKSAAAETRAADRQRVVDALTAGLLELSKRMIARLERGLAEDTARAEAIERFWERAPAVAALRARAAPPSGAAGPTFPESLWKLYDEEVAAHDFESATDATWPLIAALTPALTPQSSSCTAERARNDMALSERGRVRRDALVSGLCARGSVLPVDTADSLLRPRIRGHEHATLPPPGDYYPDIATANHWSGTPIVGVVVETDGTVSEAHILDGAGSPSLDDAALRVAHGLHFRPVTLDREPVRALVYVRIPFVWENQCPAWRCTGRPRDMIPQMPIPGGAF